MPVREAVAGDTAGHVDECLGGLLDEDAREEVEVFGVVVFHEAVECVREDCAAVLFDAPSGAVDGDLVGEVLDAFIGRATWGAGDLGNVGEERIVALEDQGGGVGCAAE